MACKNKMKDADVRAIFEALHHKAPIPDHLKFTIVPVGSSGQKLSPPSHEFPGMSIKFAPPWLITHILTLLDGLYVLLRPAKEPKDGAQSYTPPQAPDHLKHMIWKDPLPEDCPWSISGPQFSHQTAIQQRYCYPTGRAEYSSTKGGSVWTIYDANGKEDIEFRLLHVYYSMKRASNRGGPKKGRKRAKRSPKSSPACSPARSYAPPPMFHSPTNTTASSSTISSVNSPMSPRGSVDLAGFWPSVERQSFISPINDMGSYHSFPRSPSSDALSMSHESESLQGPATSPFRRTINVDALGTTVSPLHRTSAGFCMMDDYSDLWNSPILSYDDDEEEEDYYSFASQIENDAESAVRDRIIHAATEDRPSLFNQMTDWARKLANDPLADNFEDENDAESITACNF